MIHVACAADVAYVAHCAAMLLSLLANHEKKAVTVHFLLDDNLPTSEVTRLGKMVEDNFGCWNSYSLAGQELPVDSFLGRYGKVAWYRVMLPQLLSDLGRVLYLDADTIVERPLSELWETDLQGNALGAIVNPVYPFMNKSFLQRLGLSESSYFNSGVLLMDLEYWRSHDISNKVFDVAVAQGRQEWPDQNALNVALADKTLLLAPKWNAQNTYFDLNVGQLIGDVACLNEARMTPAIIHFIGPYKPWHFRCKHPWRKRYWHWRSRSPWRDGGLDGVSFKNRILRMLPETWGWRLEAGAKSLKIKRARS